MGKETFYFSHDFNARNDPKLQLLLMRIGQEGKGIFWDLIELLYEQDGYLSIRDLESHAFALRTSVDILKRVINEFELFKCDGEKFWSDSVLHRLSIRRNKSIKASESAKSRWNKETNMQTQSDSNANAYKFDANELRFEFDSNADLTNRNAIKESKVKESKVKDFNNLGNPGLYPISDFISDFNRISKRRFKEIPGLNNSLKARLRSYTKDEIIFAIKIAHEDQYHIDNGLKYLTPTFILRQDKLERYVNLKTEKQSDSTMSGKALLPKFFKTNPTN